MTLVAFSGPFAGAVPPTEGKAKTEENTVSGVRKSYSTAWTVVDGSG